MSLQHLEITGFRNLSQSKLDFSSQFNILYGQNGSGKTSLLEAIHYLSLGRSFRTRHVSRIIQHKQLQFTLYAVLAKNNITIPIGLERNRDNNQRTLINSQPARSIAELAANLPLQILTPQSYRLFLDGPKTRRQYLDWGVFHVEHSFFSNWQRANRALKQRNALLKKQPSRKDIAHWDLELIATADLIDQQRQNYYQKLQPIWSQLCETFLDQQAPNMTYQRGWDKQTPLAEVLERSYTRDCQMGHTQSGPHRADLKFNLNNIPAHDILSQGQLKLAAYALHLAQGMLYKSTINQPCCYLIDDLPAELDKDKKAKVFELLGTLSAQIFITGISPEDFSSLDNETVSMFHVKHGDISPS